MFIHELPQYLHAPTTLNSRDGQPILKISYQCVTILGIVFGEPNSYRLDIYF